ncbi:speckle targeted PIP5K1A-regulated poly(A) polymerase isoform X2 [Strigops habroptila]|uniref:speckle targeted PIP5K1A-regulated poly(A) polymerase isoform X2 n=1 Tax=Strigops habroptila TaxID=2489341 RepID=UPI0011CF0B4A|nr:speckle targeted PIP5K1A-regulated poly(A) polymerase isoform X2 [Strigops habroptila]
MGTPGGGEAGRATSGGSSPEGDGSGRTPVPGAGPAMDAGPGPAMGTGSGPTADPDPASPGPGPAMEAGPGPASDPSTEPGSDPLADPDVEALPRGGFRCRLCQVSAANRPSLTDHLRGKKHRRLRSLRAERRAQEQRSLFVSGFARGTSGEELSEYFGAFGEVAAVVMDKEKGAYAIVELQDAASRERALADPEHSLAGHRLRVRPREQKVFAYGSAGRSSHRDPLSPGRLEQVLWQASDVDSQMSQLVGLLELSEDERRVRHLLVTLFQEVFTEFFPGCAIVPFGSSVNGFDTRGCDLDLLLDLEPTKSLQVSSQGAPKAGSGSGAEDSILSDIDLATMPAPEVLELVATVLRRCVPGVRRVRAVPTARRPVVKFCHKQSGLAGDISIDNRLALLNTRFLQLCAEADERVRPLVYAVRLWAKQQGLAGNPAGGGPLLNNYALTLLVLFFLQTRSPPVLPAIARLRDLAGDEDRTVVCGWDCSFPRDVALLEPSTNTESPCSLLAEFFHTFGDFDFPGQVISLREGRALPLPPPALPEVSEGLKLGSLNLQDPFELSHNVAANVNEKTASRFGRCCRAAAKYCRSLQYRQKSSKGRAWGLTRLFQPGAVEPGAANAGAFLISIPLGSSDGSQQLGREPRGRGPWFWEVCAAIAFVLRDVLKCSCTAGKPPGAPREELGLSGDSVPPEKLPMAPDTEEEPLLVGCKRRAPETPDGTELPDGKRPRTNVPEETANWSCTVWHRVWTGRRRVRRQLQHSDGPEGPDSDELELEQKVSEAIVQQEGAGWPVEPLLCFEASAQVGGTRWVLLRLLPSPAAPGPLFRDFFHFLQSFLPTTVRRCLGRGLPGGPARQDRWDNGDKGLFSIT